MPGTQVNQIRKPQSAGTSTTYTVSVTCILAGTLPDTKIFLQRIVQPEDPKNDTFERVCLVTDFTQYGTSREAAIQAATFLYRVTALEKSYNDIETANASWKEISDRINTLVVTYDQYITEFLTGDTGNTTIYPSIDEGAKAELILAYEASEAAVSTAEAARDLEAPLCQRKRERLADLRARLVEAQSDLAVLGPAAGALNALVASYATVPTNLTSIELQTRSINGSSSALPAERALIDTQMSFLNSQSAALSNTNASLAANVQVPVGSLLATLQARVTDLTGQINALTLEVNACALEMVDLQAAVDGARNTANQALADVRAVCPDYVPGV